MRYQEVATRYFDDYKDVMKVLGVCDPTHEPRVTDHIDEIIDFITQLINKGHAYQVENDVYFAIDTYSDYGALSKQKVEATQAGARVTVRDQKKNPADFVLWKSESEQTFWQSPWGNGRPGWHIECSALAATYLGEHIDIHAGGLDLIFPHHENERAQSEALFGAPFAHCWMHNGLVTVNHEKMSKSVGNFITLEDILKEYEPMVLRYYFLTFHYSSPAEFNRQGMDAAQKSYEKITKWAQTTGVNRHQPLTFGDTQMTEWTKKLFNCLCDDLNTAAFIGQLFEYLKTDAQNKIEMKVIVLMIVHLLGLTLEPINQVTIEITDQIKELLDQREQARIAKDWKKADELRELLLQHGLTVHDKKT